MTNPSNLRQPSAGYSFTARLRIVNRPGRLASVVQHIGGQGASIAEIILLASEYLCTTREVTFNCHSETHGREVVNSLREVPDVTLLGWRDEVFELHREGKLKIDAKSMLSTTDELSRAYTPGVARVCSLIAENKDAAFDFTNKANTVAVVTDGSAVLGLGNIGPEAALPVMEGKAMLFKQFAGLNAVPICLNTQDTEKIIECVIALAPSFGGINLEDISAPRCFEIEERLSSELSIPVFHDDQHGTAVVVLAGILNALKIVGKKLENVKVVVNGFGAGGVACARILLDAGVKNLIPCDSSGVVHRGRKENMNPIKEEVSSRANPENIKGTLADAMKGADVFVGVSVPGTLNREMVQSMAKDAIVFALANPTPEIMPQEIEGIARIIATGRSDYANQVNNVLCFPGIFKGAMESRSKKITSTMKVAAARAIANAVSDDNLTESRIIPGVFDSDIALLVSNAVKKVVEAEKLSGITNSYEGVYWSNS